MNPKFNLFSNYSQFNHMHSPRFFDWVKDGTGIINFFVDDYIPKHKEFENDKPNIAMLIEPRTIQPTIYKWVEEHHDEFDIIFTHDDDILLFDNTFEIYFMNWYKSYDVPKTKAISMVCSDTLFCGQNSRGSISMLTASNLSVFCISSLRSTIFSFCLYFVRFSVSSSSLSGESFLTLTILLSAVEVSYFL